MPENLQSNQLHWVSRAAFPVVNATLFCNQAALAIALHYRQMWLAVILVITASHLMHGMLIGFHEASHGMLRKNRRLNEIDGVILGLFSFMSFSLYRAAHQSHHAHLGTEKDEEFWPFTIPRIPRWQRVLAAALELSFGIFFTPWLFFRSFMRKGSPIRNKKLRRRIWTEFALGVLLWSTIATVVTWFHAWTFFLWIYGAPAFLAGNLQSWRKYIEHVGLTGSTPNSSTRSIVADDWIGRMIAFTLLHEPFHGVHHRHSGLPHSELPRLASELVPTTPGDPAPFSSYGRALLHLLSTLPDPRVGPHWQNARAQVSHDYAAQESPAPQI